jgi:hypothetical protein
MAFHTDFMYLYRLSRPTSSTPVNTSHFIFFGSTSTSCSSVYCVYLASQAQFFLQNVKRQLISALYCRTPHHSNCLLGFGACRSLRPRKTSLNHPDHHGRYFPAFCTTNSCHAAIRRLPRCFLTSCILEAILR